MSDGLSTTRRLPEPSDAGAVERACDAFEQQWRQSIAGGTPPRIEDHLPTEAGPARSALLRELLLLEWEYQQLDGQPASFAAYLQRFAGDEEAVRAAMAMYRVEITTSGEGEAAPETVAVRTDLRVLHLHREGGLGRVWMARDERLGRHVALKEMKRHFADNPELCRRFLQEAEITGQLDHPGVVPVYGLGSHADGRPFYVMQFIRGRSLADALKLYHAPDARDRRRKRWRLELHGFLRRFTDACNAIEYAHSRGILHRDLKPDNIMLGNYGETIVVDWGLAKVAGVPASTGDAAEADPWRAATLVQPLVPQASEAAEGPVVTTSGGGDRFPTQPGWTMGTPAYMSPEQAAGNVEAVGPATDIFGLGATLFSILTGAAPYGEETREELLDQARRGAVRKPRKLNPSIPRSLEAICLKALAALPEERYASARELAEDVQRWLADEPVKAAAEPFYERMARWARRNRHWVGVGVLGLLLLTVSSIVLTVVINASRARTEAARKVAERQLERTTRALAATRIATAARSAASDPGACLELLNDRSACPPAYREFTWHYLYRACHREVHAWHAQQPVRLAGFLPGGEELYSVGADGVVDIWDAATAQRRRNLHAAQPVSAAAMSPDRHRLATASEGGKIQVWAMPQGTLACELSTTWPRNVALALSRDGRWLAALGDGAAPQVGIWETPGGAGRATFAAPKRALSLALSSDGEVLAAGGEILARGQGGLTVWRWRERREMECPQFVVDEDLFTRAHGRISCLAFGEDHNTLFAGSDFGILAQIDLERGMCKQRTWAHSGTISSVRPSPDRKYLFSAGVGTEFRARIHTAFHPLMVWSLDSLDQKTTLAGMTKEATGLDISDDAQRLLVRQKDNILVLLNCSEPWTSTPLVHPEPVAAVAFAGDGRLLLSASYNQRSGRIGVRRWQAPFDQHAPAAAFETDTDTVLMPGGQALVPRGGAGRPSGILRDAATGNELGRLRLGPDEVVAAASSDRTRVAVLSGKSSLRIWDLHSPAAARVMIEPGGPPRQNSVVALSADGTRLAWGFSQDENWVELWDLSAGVRIVARTRLAGGVSALAFSPDGQVLAVGHHVAEAAGGNRGVGQVAPASVSLCEVPEGTIRGVCKGHDGDVTALAFSPDGRTVASGSDDCQTRLWDSESGVCMAVLELHTGSIMGVAFAPDRRMLATAAYDQTARLWHAADSAFVDRREAWRFLRSLDGLTPAERRRRIEQDPDIDAEVRHRVQEMASGASLERLD